MSEPYYCRLCDSLVGDYKTLNHSEGPRLRLCWSCGSRFLGMGYFDAMRAIEEQSRHRVPHLLRCVWVGPPAVLMRITGATP